MNHHILWERPYILGGLLGNVTWCALGNVAWTIIYYERDHIYSWGALGYSMKCFMVCSEECTMIHHILWERPYIFMEGYWYTSWNVPWHALRNALWTIIYYERDHIYSWWAIDILHEMFHGMLWGMHHEPSYIMRETIYSWGAIGILHEMFHGMLWGMHYGPSYIMRETIYSWWAIGILHEMFHGMLWGMHREPSYIMRETIYSWGAIRKCYMACYG
jgi:hypothetical protein